MSIVSKITFYPKIALRYLYELLIRGLKFLMTFLTNIGLMIIGTLITISILSYNKFDPSLNTSSDDLSNNLISYPGSYAADILIQTFGFASILISIGLIIFGFFSLTKRSQKPSKMILLLFLCVITLSFSGHIISENGGIFGHLLNNQLIYLGNLIEIEISNHYKNILVLLLATTSLILGSNALLPSKKIEEKGARTSKANVKEDKPKQVKIISKEEEKIQKSYYQYYQY